MLKQICILKMPVTLKGWDFNKRFYTGLERTTYNFYISLNTLNDEKSI
jgi:hypothetical protein